MLRFGIALMALALLWLGGRALLDTFASDETKIRDAIEDARDGFDRTRMDPVLALLAGDFEDETSTYRREDLRAGLAAVFFQAKDPATKRFPFRAVIDPDSVTIAVQPGEPKSAQVSIPLAIHDVRGGGDRVAWRVQIEAGFEERDGDWKLVRTRHTTREGRFRLQ